MSPSRSSETNFRWTRRRINGRFERAASEIASLTHANIAAVWIRAARWNPAFSFARSSCRERLSRTRRRGPICRSVNSCQSPNKSRKRSKTAHQGHRCGDPEAGEHRYHKRAGSSRFRPHTRDCGRHAHFMSPSRLVIPPDSLTDVWSFGCFLYEGLTGKKAFGAPTINETHARIAERGRAGKLFPEKLRRRSAYWF